MRTNRASIEAFTTSDAEEADHGVIGTLILLISLFAIACTMPFSLFICLKVVQEYERAVIFRLGRLSGGGAKGPGLFFIIPCVDSYSVVDLRTISFDVPPQEVLTKDSVTVSVDAVVFYRIWLPTIAVANVQDYGKSTRLLAAATLRNILGTKTLSDILSERENISLSVRRLLDRATKNWGVQVERVEIKDVRLPTNLQRSMAAEAEAGREAKAKIVAAEGEQKASFALKDAADIIDSDPTALQLRYLQSLTNNAAERDSTILFPIPINMFEHFGYPSLIEFDKNA